MSMCELIMRLSKSQLDKILEDENYFWTLRNKWRDTDHCIDIDKSWHGIHFLFTNSTWRGPVPARWVIFGEIPIPKFDGGYGPAHYLTPSQVLKVHDLLENISIEELKIRYDPVKFDAANIYPRIWIKDNEEGLDYLLHFYSKLKILYHKTADEGEYVLMIIG